MIGQGIIWKVRSEMNGQTARVVDSYCEHYHHHFI